MAAVLYVAGWAPHPEAPPGRPVIVRDRPPFPDSLYKLTTIGPAPMTESPAGPGNPVDVCAKALALKQTIQGLPSGWIKPSLANSILHDLDQFKTNLEKGRKDKADQELAKILSRIDNALRDAGHGNDPPKISQEAYHLIKATVEYLRVKTAIYTIS